MGLLKKRKKLPFLLATGVFLLLSASFMAVYFWSEKGLRRGVASALEAPVMPPSLNSPEIVVPPSAPEASAKEDDGSQAIEKPVKDPAAKVIKTDPRTAKKLEDEKVVPQKVRNNVVEKASSQEIGLQKPDEMLQDYSDNKAVATAAPVKVVAPGTVKVEEVQVKKSASAKEEKAAKKAARKDTRKDAKAVSPEKMQKKAADKPVKVKKARSSEKELPKASEAEIKQKNIEKKKPARTAQAPSANRRKVLNKKASAEIPTKVPPEWDWFKAPLKVDRVKGKVLISSSSDAVESTRPVHKKYGKDSKVRAVEKTKEVSTKTEIKEEKPFARALARMAKLKAKRRSDNKSSLQQLEAAQKPLEKVSPALKRINDLLKKLKAQSNAIQMTQRLFERQASSADSSSKGSVEINSSDSDSGKISSTTSCHKMNEDGIDEPESSVSGGFSMRMREFVRSGAWLNSR